MVECLKGVRVMMGHERDRRDSTAMSGVAQIVPNSLLECRGRKVKQITPGGVQATTMAQARMHPAADSWQRQAYAGKMPQHLPGILGAVPANRDSSNVTESEALAPKTPANRMGWEMALGNLEAGESLFLAECPHLAVANEAGGGVFTEGANSEDVHGSTQPLQM
jgi:hypothetical protein